MLALLLSTILLMVPIGYSFIMRAFSWNGDPQVLLRSFRISAIQIALEIIILGTIAIVVLARTITYPIEQMLALFQKVEEGDLSQRAKIISTDESGQLEVYFNRMIARLETLQWGLEEEVKRQTRLLRIGLEIGRISSAILSEDDIASKATNLITERMGYTYAAIFFVDSSGRWAELRASSQTAEHPLPQKKRRYDISEPNIVSAAISLRKPQATFDVQSEIFHLEKTASDANVSEVALPLIARNRVIGALDIQSDKEGELEKSSLEALENVARQIAIALENARLFHEVQQNLRDLRSAQRQYVKEAWSSLLSQSEKIEAQVEEAPLYLAEEESTEEVKVPLTLREQIIGEIMLEGEGELTEDELGWVEEVATQAALALENARLLEESQQIALHERLIAEISQRIWASPSVESILQTAIKELGDTLGASEAEIEIKIEEE
jgi:GAF domain-containing protein/HAMP domain-containing protein